MVDNHIGPVIGSPCSLCRRPLTAVSFGSALEHVVTCVDCDKVLEWPSQSIL